MVLTIAYMTARRDCKVEWFRDSLVPQILPTDQIRVVVVDFFHAERKWAQLPGWYHVPPKPTVHQGPHRLTKNDYFAPSNARNTALCYAPDGWIAYVDDLSILGDKWLAAVREAMDGGYIACGAFEKVEHLEVQRGKVVSFMERARLEGKDHRWSHGSGEKAVECAPNWLFGCSVALPVSALEKINGWPEAVCDASGIGAEDSMTGLILANTGHKLKYDRRMFTYESEEHHFQLPMMKRIERGEIGKPNSMSHAVVRMLQHAKHCDNDFSPFPDIAAMRRHVLGGGEFPIPKNPRHLWYTGELLSDL